MKPLTLLAALVAALQLSSSSAVASGDWTWPVRGEVITQYRNGDDPYAAGQHRGIDIAAAVGAPVVAAAGGNVTFAGVAGSSGLTVSIRTADGRFDTSYLHLSSAAVRAGQPVSEGQRIGAVGTTGRRSAEQPHLHFGVREAGKRQAYVDPLDLLAPPPAAPRPEPAPPRTAPVPVGDRVPIRLPGVAVAPSAVPSPVSVATPRALASALPATRASAPPAARHAHAAHVPHAARHVGSVPVAGHAPGAPRPAPRARSQASSKAVGRPHPSAPRIRLDAGPRDQVAPAGDSASAAMRQPSARRSSDGGFDPGWLAACIGLVAAACALGRPDGARAMATRGRDAFASILRPLGGRG